MFVLCGKVVSAVGVKGLNLQLLKAFHKRVH